MAPLMAAVPLLILSAVFICITNPYDIMSDIESWWLPFRRMYSNIAEFAAKHSEDYNKFFTVTHGAVTNIAASIAVCIQKPNEPHSTFKGAFAYSALMFLSLSLALNKYYLIYVGDSLFLDASNYKAYLSHAAFVYLIAGIYSYCLFRNAYETSKEAARAQLERELIEAEEKQNQKNKRQ